MKILLKTIFAATLTLPAFAFADTVPQTTTVEKVQAAAGVMTAKADAHNHSTPVITPRTGIRHT